MTDEELEALQQQNREERETLVKEENEVRTLQVKTRRANLYKEISKNFETVDNFIDFYNKNKDEIDKLSSII